VEAGSCSLPVPCFPGARVCSGRRGHRRFLPVSSGGHHVRSCVGRQSHGREQAEKHASGCGVAEGLGKVCVHARARLK